MTRLLVVDDEISIRNLLKTFLSRDGYDVTVAEDAMSAQEFLNRGDFDIVISDIVLPGMSGVDLLQLVRQKHPRVQVILLTGMPNTETASEAVRSGAFDYLTKPIDLKAIRSAVSNAIKVKALDDERARLEKENKRYAEHLEQMVAERTNELQETGARLQLAIRASNIGLWDWNFHPPVAHYSPEWKRQIGYADEDISARYEEWEDRLHPDDREPALAAIRASMASPWPVYEKEYRLRHKDGTYRWIYARGEVSRGADGEPLRIVGCHVDITEIKRNEGARRESESRYRRLFESAREGILILEAESGRIVDLNPYLLELLGYPRDYFLNKVLWEVPLFQGVALSQASFADLRKNGRVGCEDLPMETRDGRHIEVEFVSHIYQTDDSEAIQCNLRDVTGRNTMLNHLRNLNEMQSKFVAEASHEIRTPLTIIKESVLQVLDGLCGDLTPGQKDVLTLCMQGIERLKAVVNDLLDISKLEAGKTMLVRDYVDMGQLIEEIRQTFLAQARAKNLTLEVTEPRPAAWGYLDRGRVLQVLTNLVGNAIKFTPQGQVRLSVSDKGDQIECSVADTGTGIAEAELPKVFGRFLQFGSSYTGPGGGTGLGLSIAKSLVELHGGKIRVQSALNQGTTFTFTVPKLSETDVLKERMDAVIATAQQENRELLAILIRVTDISSSPAADPDTKGSESLRVTIDLLDRAIRRKGFSPVRGKDCILILTETGEDRTLEINTLLRQTVSHVIFDRDKRFRTSFGYGWRLYPQDGANAQVLLDKVRDSLAADMRAHAGKSILIVDDDPHIVRTMRSILAILGYTNTTTACDGCEALDRIAESLPALIILDMNMPKMNGYEFIGRVKHNILTARMPLLIMTGYAVDPGKLEAHHGPGTIPTLAKPVDIDTLGKWVRFLI
jgi:PAS domain S-box-containing protein